MKPSGIKTTQFSMLANIAGNPGLTVSELAKLLWLEQTTVSRNLQVLEKSGYILLEAEAADFRIKRIWMTDNGQSKVEEARPFWEQAQWEMERTWGREGIGELLESLKRIAE
ncbi:MAG: winged helix-turn-helix transcriptional regulator [Deltaproteobacteria bacterium]|nr:winged helix-turn-helix transcriptional regulator [Deltaproteobacteria bacterium]